MAYQKKSGEELEKLAEATANKILDAFRSGNIPAAIAKNFIRRKDDVPCRRWSFNNQMLCAIAGHDDARTFVAWQNVGRSVKKGEKAFYILEPKKIWVAVKGPDGQPVRDANGKVEKRPITVGFKVSPRFGLGQTEGEPLPVDHEAENWIESLPLKEVADAWGVTVTTYNGDEYGPQGKYSPTRNCIALGVKNLSTWAHEMVHKADDKLGNLKERGQHWRSETVAELGGAILLHCIGEETEADIGGCWEYVNHYAAAAGIDTVKACMDTLDRAGRAVALILETAENAPVKVEDTEAVAA